MFGSVSSNFERFDAFQSQSVYAMDNAIVSYCTTKEAHHGFVPTLSQRRHSECKRFCEQTHYSHAPSAAETTDASINTSHLASDSPSSAEPDLATG